MIDTFTNLLKDYFINFPNDIYVFLRQYYVDYDGGFIIVFVCLCVFFYLLVYGMVHAGNRKYNTKEALVNIADETGGKYEQKGKGEKATRCLYSGRIFEIINSNPGLNPYFKIKCPVNSQFSLKVEQGSLDSVETSTRQKTSDKTLADKIMTDPGFAPLLGLGSELYVEKGEIESLLTFDIFSEKEEKSFIDEQKVYDALGRLAQMAALIESCESAKTSA